MSSCWDAAASACPVNEMTSCPRCGASGARVHPITLKALLTSAALRRGVPQSPRFCATQGCRVVYFDTAGSAVFTEEDMTVRAYAKHPFDTGVMLCHCFDYDAASVAAAPNGAVRRDITREVQAGHCACEVRNPRGVCCLGDIMTLERRLGETAAEKD
jgi:hypothetical protein